MGGGLTMKYACGVVLYGSPDDRVKRTLGPVWARPAQTMSHSLHSLIFNDVRSKPLLSSYRQRYAGTMGLTGNCQAATGEQQYW